MAEPDHTFTARRFEQIQQEAAALGHESSQVEDKMSPGPTREEIDAKLAAVEARTEMRFVELSGKIDRVMDAISTVGNHVSDEIGFVKSELSTVKSDNKNTRFTIIIAVVTSLIAGIGALWLTQANLLASFSAGIAVHEVQKPQSPPTPTK
jgi:hypothetical protein